MTLNGTTWVFKDVLDLTGFADVLCKDGNNQNIPFFSCGNTEYKGITGVYNPSTGAAMEIDYTSSNENEVVAYDSTASTKWKNSDYKTITFFQEPNSGQVSDFIKWLCANATQTWPTLGNYVVAGNDLRNIANALRGKAGTTDSLTFPDGFLSVINSIT